MSATTQQSMSKVPEVTLLFWVIKIVARRFNRFLYWTTIIATTTVGTTLADFADRSLGIGYAGGTTLLFALLIASLAVWYRAMGSVSVDTVSSPRAEMFYWVTIMFSQTLGTALDGGHRRPGLRRRRCRVQRSAGVGRRRIPLDQNLTHCTVLGGIHSHPAAGGGGRRFSRQTGQCWRDGVESLLGIRRIAALHHCLPGAVPAACGDKKPLM